MHDMGVAFHVHQVANFDGAVFTDAAQVVAAQIHQHHVFRTLLFILTHLSLQALVLGFIFAARMRSGYGTVFQILSTYPHQHFR